MIGGALAVLAFGIVSSVFRFAAAKPLTPGGRFRAAGVGGEAARCGSAILIRIIAGAGDDAKIWWAVSVTYYTSDTSVSVPGH